MVLILKYSEKKNELGNSCGGDGEFGISGKCKQPGVVPFGVHAFFAVGIG